jgi:serine/threonine-protein kinase RsbW
MGSQAHQPSRLHLEVPSRMDDVSEALERLHDFVHTNLACKESVYRARLAFNEALTNALKHGNQYQPEKQITVKAKVNGHGLIFTVEDEGTGFERKAVESPVTDQNLYRTHGRGIHLLEELADEIAFECDGRRLRVTIAP